MILFLGIFAILTGGALWVVAIVTLGSMAMDGGPIKTVACLTGIIPILTTTIWAAESLINHHNAPHTTCGASLIQEES